MSDNTNHSKQQQTLSPIDLQTLKISSCPELIDLIQQVGFLPLLDSGITGFCAEELVSEEYRYIKYKDGSWEWALWKWKGPVVTEGDCVYGKFFAGKAGFISRKWWADFYNWRRSKVKPFNNDSIEEAILSTLRAEGSMIARELRAECGMTGANMRSRFDAYINRLQMSCFIVTEDFVYPTDKHGHEYGFGWSLLTTPERLLGYEHCHCERSPQESLTRMTNHLTSILGENSLKKIARLLQ